LSLAEVIYQWIRLENNYLWFLDKDLEGKYSEIFQITVPEFAWRD
jgi:hypothetical protein